MPGTSCPFCGSEVPSDLVAFGGTCPKCLAEIPGDEAPTDPGVEVRRKQESRDRLRARIPLAIALVMFMGLVSCTGVLALTVVLWPNPEVAELLDFDTLDVPLPDIASAPEGGLPEPAPSKGKTTKGKGTPSPDPRPGQPDPAPAPNPGAEPDPVPGRPDLRPKPAGGTSGGVSIGPTRIRRDDGRVLTDPEEIRLMIGERMGDSIPMLQACYERRLKVDDTLAGRWSLTFTVQKDGTVANAAARGLERSDPELESCIRDLVTDRWRFSKINLAQPVKRTVRFSR